MSGSRSHQWGVAPCLCRPIAARSCCSETNVDVTSALKPDAAYDLALYLEQGNPSRGVLVVTVILNFKFKEGKSKGGSKLAWSSAESGQFMTDVTTALRD